MYMYFQSSTFTIICGPKGTDAQDPLGMHPHTAIVFVGRIMVIKELDPYIQSWQNTVLAGEDELYKYCTLIARRLEPIIRD